MLDSFKDIQKNKGITRMNDDKRHYEISVIVTAYNNGKYLIECIESIAKQDFNGFEIILIDDGSTDETQLVVRNMLNSIPNFSYYRQINSGVSVARNLGMSKADGTYICFVDGDDKLEPEYLSKLYSNLDENTDIVCCDCNAFNDNGYESYFFFEAPMKITDISGKELLICQLMNGNFGKSQNARSFTAIGVPWGKLYRKAFVEKHLITFDDRLRRMQDNDFNLRAFYYAQRINYIHMPLYDYRIDHIQGFRMPAAPELWSLLITKRKEFIDSHKDLQTDNIIKEEYYERYVALSNSLLHYTRYNPRQDAKYLYRQIEKMDIYYQTLRYTDIRHLPFKFRALKFMYNHHAYNSIYMMFYLYIKKLSEHDNEKKFSIKG